MGAIYFGSTVLEWLTAFLLILLSFIVGKIIYWIFKNWIKLIVSKTKGKLDDIIVDTAEEPVVFLIVIIGIRLGMSQLNLPQFLGDWSDRAFKMIVAVFSAWLIPNRFIYSPAWRRIKFTFNLNCYSMFESC